MAAHNELGTWGEQCAVEYLRRKGYVILERDWKSGHRDLDIIAFDGATMVFVEVKTRRNRMFADPEMAVDYVIRGRSLPLRGVHSGYIKLNTLSCNKSRRRALYRRLCSGLTEYDR